MLKIFFSISDSVLLIILLPSPALLPASPNVHSILTFNWVPRKSTLTSEENLGYLFKLLFLSIKVNVHKWHSKVTVASEFCKT